MCCRLYAANFLFVVTGVLDTFNCLLICEFSSTLLTRMYGLMMRGIKLANKCTFVSFLSILKG